jgi:hypothetical protein
MLAGSEATAIKGLPPIDSLSDAVPPSKMTVDYVVEVWWVGWIPSASSLHVVAGWRSSEQVPSL